MGTVQYFDEPCTFAVRRGNVVVEWPTGERIAFPLEVFRVQLARANEAIAAYDAKTFAREAPEPPTVRH